MREPNLPDLVEEPVARAPLPLREEEAPRPPPPPALLPVRPRRPRRPTHLLRKLAVAAGAMVALYALVVGVVAPPIVRAIAETKLTAALERPTTIERIRIQPFTLTVTVRGLMVRDRDGTRFVSFDELRVNLQAMSLLRRGLIVHDVTLVRPVVRLVHDRAHHYNVSDLLEAGGSPPSSEPSRYSINNIRVLEGTIEIVDRPRGRTHVIRDLTIALPFVSNLPYDVDAYVQPALSARVGDTVVNLGARAKPFLPSRETVVDLDVRDLQLARYFDYVPGPLGFTLPAATLDAALSIELQKRPDERPRLSVSGRLALKDVVANDVAGRPLVRFARLALDVAPSQPLAGTLTLARVQLDRPSLWVRRDAGGRLQLATLGPARNERAPVPRAAAAGTPFVVDAATVRLADGTIRFFDAPAGGPFVATLRDVTLEARGFSTAAGHATALELHAASDAGEHLDDRGTLTLTPLSARGHLSLTGIPLARYAPYHRPLVNVDVDGGTLDVAADYDVRSAGPTIVVGGGELALRGLALRRRGERRELAAAALIAVHDLDADVMARTLQLGDVATRDGRLRLVRAADGTLNVAGLVPPSPAPAAAAPSPPWSIAVKHAALDAWTLRFEDRRPDPDEPVRLTVALQSASIADYASTRGHPTRVALRARIDRRGAVTASGTVVPEPLAATLRVDGKTIDLPPLQPYFADRVNLLVTRGAVSFGGKLALATTAQGEKVRYQGHLLLDELTTVDAEAAEPLLSWDSLYVAGIDATNAPPAVAIDEVSLTGFHARLAVDDAGALNVRGLVPPSPSPPPPSPSPSPSPRAAVSVGKVTLQDGTIDWADDFVRPRFAATLSEVGGRISGLSSRPDTVADVDVRGKLEGIAPLEVSGKLNPLAKELSLDLAVAFRDIELGPLSPYSGKYAGYDIARGKLTLELAYNVQQRKLSANNKVFIDQLQLGDRVKSPQATKLPVKFIVFVLRDRKGEIHLELPINGSLDDPKFRLGPIILKAILNVLVKAATQPFALLGSMFGRGPELAYVEFAPGRADLDAAALDKLRVVAKVLDSRPGLKLEISGHVGVDADREGLRRLLFERKVKSQKLKALAKRHESVGEPVDRLVVAPDEYERYLRAAYDDEKFPKPRNAIGLVKKLPVGEMEKLMLTHIVVPDEELRLLAQRRAEAARDTLVKARIAPERIFVREPKTLAAPPLDKARATRVDFTIR